jgi:UDPglucose--hexose-1-phosphate uridylyltransferase
MSDLRKDPVIGRWVIIATERSKRPGALIEDPVVYEEDSCSFCEGHERETPPEVLAFRSKSSLPNERGWWVRVVPNLFPAMKIEGQIRRVGEGMFDKMNGIGAHEVVIESPAHRADMAGMERKQIEEILWAYRERTIDLYGDRRFRYVMIFKNHGARAGATREHSHSQIIALPIVPKRVQEEVEGAASYYDYKERCVFCDMIRQEERDKARIVAANELFIAFHPYASRFPFETWILPRQHESFFSDIQMNEVADLAAILKHLLERFKTVLGSPAFNYVIHTAPHDKEDTPSYHWHLEVIPRMTNIAGFEWGTGFYINPIAPEEAGKRILEGQPLLAAKEAALEPSAG